MIGPFVPTPFANPVIDSAAYAGTPYRRAPYISPSEYRFTPTAVGTQGLVPGSDQQATDSTVALLQEIERASSWMDQHAFHVPDGTFAASVSTEKARIKVKPNGELCLISNFKPILEVVGIGVGADPGLITNLAPAPPLWWEGQVIRLPPGWTQNPATSFPVFTWRGPYAYVVWQTVNGFPHVQLAANVAAHDTTISVTPSSPDGTTVVGIYPNTPLQIVDGAKSETVVVQSVSGTTLTLVAGTQFDHEIPTAPDFIRVSAIPWAIEQACVSLTSVLLKTRGNRSFVLPGAPGSAATRKAMAQAGALDDFDNACRLLKPYVIPFVGHL